MSAVIEPDRGDERSGTLTLLESADPGRTFAWCDGRQVSVAEFLADVRRLRALLPGSGSAINLCDDRYVFTAALCAAASLGRTTLLPSSRARQAIADVQSAHAGACVLGDSATCNISEHMVRLPRLDDRLDPHGRQRCTVVATDTAVIGFTSGSTGIPKPNAKTWEGFRIGSLLNSDVLCAAMALDPGDVAHVVATVPAQHMYGMELSVLLPLFGPFAVHSGRPFFPADIARALEQIPAPRVLVTTPVHLRAILHDAIELPPLAAIVSATAPLSTDLAAQSEARLGAPLIEMFGSTETCVIAYRRTANETDWTLHEGVSLQSQPDGTLVNARHLPMAVSLQDIVEVLPGGRFRLCGRNADLLEIAGKRASLADLSRRLLSLEGVEDAVVFQLEAEAGSQIQRIAALAVAPGRTEKSLLAEMRDAVDPLFLPRPLRLVDALPRNETGKLPRSALLAALKNTKTDQ
jgi:acyl-coenzyme A synthetase/AMP-(fatty) acid ligase